MKSSDVIVIGGGIIGLSLAWELRKSGARVQLLERGETGHEASYAAAGMIAVCDPHNDPAVQVLAERSAGLYLEFVHEIEDESGTTVDFRDQGVITFLDPSSYSDLHPSSRALDASEIKEREPSVTARENAFFLPECWVDPRRLCAALLLAYRHRDGDLASGSPVHSVEKDGNTFVVQTEQTLLLRRKSGELLRRLGRTARQSRHPHASGQRTNVERGAGDQSGSASSHPPPRHPCPGGVPGAA